MYQTLSNGSTSLATETDMRRHAERRKMWNYGFTPTALNGYDDIIFKRATQLVDRLAQQTGSIDLSKWMGYFT